jgi:hypothetical protein
VPLQAAVVRLMQIQFTCFVGVCEFMWSMWVCWVPEHIAGCADRAHGPRVCKHMCRRPTDASGWALLSSSGNVVSISNVAQGYKVDSMSKHACLSSTFMWHCLLGCCSQRLVQYY